MAHCSIGQERFGFAGRMKSRSSLDTLAALIDWSSVSALLDQRYPAAKGEPARTPLAMFKALLLSIWYELSDVKFGRGSRRPCLLSPLLRLLRHRGDARAYCIRQISSAAGWPPDGPVTV